LTERFDRVKTPKEANGGRKEGVRVIGRHHPTGFVKRPTELVNHPTEPLNRPTELVKRPTGLGCRPTELGCRPTERGCRPTGFANRLFIQSSPEIHLRK
jgi:hypothetical protein